MSWSDWMDSPEEREDYLFAVHNMVPYTAGMWGQPMFTLKYTSCEDPTREGCSCVSYDAKHPRSEGIEYANGGVWSEILAIPWEKMWDDQKVDEHM